MSPYLCTPLVIGSGGIAAARTVGGATRRGVGAVVAADVLPMSVGCAHSRGDLTVESPEAIVRRSSAVVSALPPTSAVRWAAGRKYPNTPGAPSSQMAAHHRHD